MASGFKNSAGVDLDDIYVVSPSSQYSAGYYMRNTGHDVWGRIDNAGSEIQTSTGQNLFDRYVHESYGTKASSTNSNDFEAQFYQVNSSGQQTSVPVESVDLWDVCAKKGSVGAPYYSSSTNNISDSHQVGDQPYTHFTTSSSNVASGNPQPTGYTVSSYTISGGGSNTSLLFDGDPTISSSGMLAIKLKGFVDFASSSGSEVYNIQVKVKASNAFGTSNTRTVNLAQTVTWVSSGGGGCFDRDTMVKLPDGSETEMKNLKVGSVIMGLDIDGVIDESVEGWEYWASENLDAEEVQCVVKGFKEDVYPEHYIINGTTRVTYEHPLLVYRDETWSWVTVENLVLGDVLYNNETIQSITKVDDYLAVVALDVEEIDNYFIKTNNTWVIAHNAPQKGGDF